MNRRKPYVRSMEGWWRKNPYYIRYMLRESTSVFVALYVLVLLAGVASLSAGEAAYHGWLAALRSPLAILFHLIALAAACFHAVTWFAVAPKVMPPIFIGEQRVSDRTVVVAQYAIAIVLSLVLLGLVVRA